MFAIHLGEIERFDGATIAASARSLASALDFIGEFYDGPLALSWAEVDGRWVADVYDWLDCWFPNPPARARIVTPRGFGLPDCDVWFRNRLNAALS